MSSSGGERVHELLQQALTCADECRAVCCRTAVLPVTDDEYESLFPGAPTAGVGAVQHKTSGELAMAPAPPGSRYVRLAELGGCPHLDQSTNLCKVYEQRPQACCEFPTAPTPGCLLDPAPQPQRGLWDPGGGFPVLIVGESQVVLSTPEVARLRAGLERWESKL